MTTPLEIHLDHPIEVDNIRHDKLILSDFNALMSFRTNSPEQVIRSMSLCFKVPRKTIRRLHPDDANRAGDLLKSALDDVARSLQSFE